MWLATQDLVPALSPPLQHSVGDGKVQTVHREEPAGSGVTSPVPLTLLVFLRLILGKTTVNKETTGREPGGWESVHKGTISSKHS